MPLSAHNRTILNSLGADAFVSERDRAALRNIERLPVLPTVVRKFNEMALDRLLYVQNSAESVRCGERQFPTVYGMLREACAILDVPEPELYLRYDSRYNAYTAGVQRPFITLQSALVQEFGDDELMFVIGHELGHIKCEHVLYLMIGRLLLPLLDALGQMTLGMGKLAGVGLVSAFLEWMRQSEFSCDRAGLLVCQDPQVAYRSVMKLGAGSSRFDREMNVDAFLEQAREHREAAGLDGVAKTLLFILYAWQLEHPQVVYRAAGLEDWVKSGAYRRILDGKYDRKAAGGTVFCGGCGSPLTTATATCPKCGKFSAMPEEEPI